MSLLIRLIIEALGHLFIQFLVFYVLHFFYREKIKSNPIDPSSSTTSVTLDHDS